MKCFFTTVYSLGLRLREVLQLQIADIDAHRMLVHIRRGKGAKDRLMPLPMSTLLELRSYVFRVASRNFRIVSVVCNKKVGGKVTFSIKRSRSQEYRPMKVRAEEFFRRFLRHVLPSGFQKVRHYGFMHKRSKISVFWLAMLVTVTLNMVYQLDITVPELKQKRTLLCPDAINSICRGPS